MDAAPKKVKASMSHAKRESVAATLALFAQKWPDCFSIYGARRRPLKIGIDADIAAALGIAPADIKSALAAYTLNKIYLRHLVEGVERIGLDGAPAGVVTRDQASYARSRLTHSAKPESTNPKSVPPKANPQRLSLADLRAAGAARRGQASC